MVLFFILFSFVAIPSIFSQFGGSSEIQSVATFDSIEGTAWNIDRSNSNVGNSLRSRKLNRSEVDESTDQFTSRIVNSHSTGHASDYICSVHLSPLPHYFGILVIHT